MAFKQITNVHFTQKCNSFRYKYTKGITHITTYQLFVDSVSPSNGLRWACSLGNNL